MTAVVAIVGGVSVLLVIASKIAGRRMTSNQLATFVQWAREAFSEPLVYRVATDAERKAAPSVNVEGMRELGGIATTFRGTTSVSRYVIDETGTIAHRARIAKAAAPLVRITTIEQLVEINARSSRRTADWRAAQDEGTLFEADLRSILRADYERRAASVKAKLGSLAPRARVIA